MSTPKIKYQQITIQVTNPNQEYPIEAETDKLYNRVTGINVVMGDDKNKFSTLELDINMVEVFPEKFEVLRVMFRNQVPFGYEYHELNEVANGSKVKGKFKDVNNGAAYPYSMTLSLRLENK